MNEKIDKLIEELRKKEPRNYFALSLLDYIKFLRGQIEDVEIKGCGRDIIYDAKTLEPIASPSSPLKAYLLHMQEVGKTTWLYLYIPNLGEFAVLKDDKLSNINKTVLANVVGGMINVCAMNGTLRHYAGLNKIKRFPGRREEYRGTRTTIIEYHKLRPEKLYLPCANADVAQLLRKLRIIPPLIVELPPNNDEKPRLGLVMPIIEKGDKLRVDICDITSRNTNDCVSLSFSRDSIICIDIVEYLKQKYFQYFSSTLRLYLTIDDFDPSLLKSNDDKPLRIALNTLQACNNDLYKRFYDLWQREGRGRSKFEFFKEFLNDKAHYADYLQYIPRPEVLERYDNKVVEEMFIAMNKLRVLGL